MKKAFQIILIIILLIGFNITNAISGEGFRGVTSNNKDGQYSIPSFYSLESLKGPGGLMIGFRLMPTITSLDVKDEGNGIVTAKSKLGYGIGGLIGINMTDHIGLQVEGIYSALAQQYRQDDYVADINLKYINVPVLLVLNTNSSMPVNFNVAFGPQLGLNVGSDLNVTEGGQTAEARLAVKKGDIGFAYGAGVDFGLAGMKLCVGFRGVFGLVNISDDSGTIETGEYYIFEKTNIQTYSAYVGLTFGG